jgi:stalled ribosome rescue protein Dom34
MREDIVVYGSTGKITFSVFENVPLLLTNNEGETKLIIEHPENIQLHHVQQMHKSLTSNSKHPSDGNTATHTSWIMDKIVEYIIKETVIQMKPTFLEILFCNFCNDKYQNLSNKQYKVSFTGKTKKLGERIRHLMNKRNERLLNILPILNELQLSK